jgi:predicted RecB family endonuclease
LTYWLREGRSSNAEVDFVAEFEGQIVQIEVKAGGRGSSRSLHPFVGEKAADVVRDLPPEAT